MSVGTPSVQAGIKSRNVCVNGRRATLRLERAVWEALEEVSLRESVSVNDLCALIAERLSRNRRLEEDEASNLTSAVRVFVTAYFREAATEDGHGAAGHGRGNPLAGTPFDHIEGGQG